MNKDRKLKAVVWSIFPFFFLALLCAAIFYKYLLFGLTLSPAYELQQYFQAGFTKPHHLLIHDPSPQYLHLPNLIFNKQCFQSGRLPLWNPNYGGGVPHLGEFQSAPFSLLRIFYYWSPASDDYSFFLFMKTLAMGLSAYLLARFLGISLGGGVLTGLIFIANGYSVFSLYLLDGESLVFLPLILIAGEKLFLSASRRLWILILGLLEGLLLLSGHPEIIYIIVLGGAVYFAIHGAVNFLTLKNSRMVFKIGIAHSVAIGLGLLIAGFMLREFWVFLQQGINCKIGSHKLMAPDFTQNLILWGNLFFPDPLHLGLCYPLHWHLGILPIFLCLVAATGLKKRLWPLVGMGLFALGAIYNLPGIRNLPLMQGYSLQYFFGLPMLAAAVLTGYGLDRLLALNVDKRLIVIGTLYFLIFAGLALIFQGTEIAFLRKSWRIYFSLVAGVLPLAAWVIFLFGHTRLNSKLIKALLTLIIAVILIPSAQRFLYYNKFIPAPKPASLPDPDRRDHLMRVKQIPIPYGASLLGRQSFDDLSPIFIRRYFAYSTLLNRTLAQSGWNQGEQPLTVVRNLINLTNTEYILSYLWGDRTTALNAQYLDYGNLFNLKNDVNFILKGDRPHIPPPPAVMAAWGFNFLHQENAVAIFHNDAVLPRAFLVGQVIKIPETKDNAWVQQQLSDPNLDFSRIAIAEYDSPQSVVELEKITAEESLKGKVDIMEYLPDRIVLRVMADRWVYLVLGDAYYPGWRAGVDGGQAHIFPTNLMFRGLPIPPGDHRVEFRYRPMATLVLLKISVALIICILLLLLFVLVKRIKQKVKY